MKFFELRPGWGWGGKHPELQSFWQKLSKEKKNAPHLAPNRSGQRGWGANGSVLGPGPRQPRQFPLKTFIPGCQCLPLPVHCHTTPCAALVGGGGIGPPQSRGVEANENKTKGVETNQGVKNAPSLLP